MTELRARHSIFHSVLLRSHVTTHGDITTRHHRSTILTTLSAQPYLKIFTTLLPLSTLQHLLHEPCTFRFHNTNSQNTTTFHIATLITNTDHTTTSPPRCSTICSTSTFIDNSFKTTTTSTTHCHNVLDYNDAHHSDTDHDDPSYNDTTTIGLAQLQVPHLGLNPRYSHVRARCSEFLG